MAAGNTMKNTPLRHDGKVDRKSPDNDGFSRFMSKLGNSECRLDKVAHAILKIGIIPIDGIPQVAHKLLKCVDALVLIGIVINRKLYTHKRELNHV